MQGARVQSPVRELKFKLKKKSKKIRKAWVNTVHKGKHLCSERYQRRVWLYSRASEINLYEFTHILVLLATRQSKKSNNYVKKTSCLVQRGRGYKGIYVSQVWQHLGSFGSLSQHLSSHPKHID